MSASRVVDHLRRSAAADSAAIAAAAFLLRLAHLLSLRSLPTFTNYIMDEAYHDAWAKRIASGDWLGQEAFFRAPLYPYLLGLVYRLFGAGGTAPRLIQILIGSLSVLLLHRIALRVSGRAAAAVAASLMALCWPLIYFDNELVITVLEVFLSLATILLLMRADDSGRALSWMLGGLTLGLAAIARPNMLLFAPAACLFAGWPRPRGRARAAPPLLVLAGLIVPILPVTLHNEIVGHDLVLISSQGGVNFFIGNNPESDGTTAVVPGTRPTWQGGYEDAIALATRDMGGDLKPSGVSRYWFARGFRFWREQPAAALRLLGRKTMLFVSGVEISNNKDLTFFRGLSPVLSLPLPASNLLSPLGILGWAVAWRRREARHRAMLPPLLFAVSYAASIIVFFVTSRYRAPVLPILALGTALFCIEWTEMARRGPRSRAFALLAAAAVLVVALNLNLYGYADDPGQGHMSLAEAYQVAGNHQAALAEFDASIAAGGPYRYEAWRGKGDELASLGRVSEAFDALSRSLESRPGNPEVLASLLEAGMRAGRYDEGRALALGQTRAGDPAAAAILFTVGSADQTQGRLADAESEYRAALHEDPDHLGARVNLALLLRGAGRLEESLEELQEAERMHPDDPIVQIDLAKHYLFIGDRQEALRRVERARARGGRIDPGFRQALGLP